MQERSCKGKEQAKTLKDLAIYSYLRFVDYLYLHSHFRDNLGNNFSSIPLFILLRKWVVAGGGGSRVGGISVYLFPS